MVNSDYLKNLNEAQKEAVMHLDGPLLIVAGAGSGKTKVLTSRIANIIKDILVIASFYLKIKRIYKIFSKYIIRMGVGVFYIKLCELL